MHNSNLLESHEINHIHFIGIGGISMSGLAEILLSQGYKISGSDMKASDTTKKLGEMGIKIDISHTGENLHDPDLVVYTAAIKEDNPELMKARTLDVPVIDRATLLGMIMRRYPNSIAVSGTHGKTTTTSMISMIMLESGADPTIHIGGELDAIGGSTKIGGNDYFIAEACEYVESFLKFYPFMAVVLNIDADHLDYYRDIEHIKDSFYKFLSLVPAEGYVVACADDPNITELLGKLHCSKITYGIDSTTAAWAARDIRFDSRGCASFNTYHHGEFFTDINLNVPGIHNVSNALAAIAACSTLNCSKKAVQQGLGKFFGTHRRFELKGTVEGIKVIDDYAHHPSEVKATLRAAKNTKHGKVWCVFQPHTYTRTKCLLDEFATAFADADNIIVADIYAAREKDTGEIHSSMLVQKIAGNGKNTIYLKDFENISDYLIEHAHSGDLILTMGAGDIYKVGEMFLDKKKRATAV